MSVEHLVTTCEVAREIEMQIEPYQRVETRPRKQRQPIPRLRKNKEECQEDKVNNCK